MMEILKKTIRLFVMSLMLFTLCSCEDEITWKDATISDLQGNWRSSSDNNTLTFIINNEQNSFYYFDKSKNAYTYAFRFTMDTYNGFIRITPTENIEPYQIIDKIHSLKIRTNSNGKQIYIENDDDIFDGTYTKYNTTN